MTTLPAPLPTTESLLTAVDDRTWRVRATGPRIELTLPPGPAFVLDASDGELFVLPDEGSGNPLRGRGTCWALPASPSSTEPGWLVRADAPIEVTSTADGTRIVVAASEAVLVRHRARPHADVHGDEFALDLPDAGPLADALAGFYWGTLLPCVVERTLAADLPDSHGFVVSTLADTYRGTYPDVDHEFQVKGRLAWGSDTDTAVVRRMLELQLRLMAEDPQGLWRDPCAVQPDGTREYHVRRNSLDNRENAVMFLVTGNVEVLESIWLYVARTGDLEWLRSRIEDVEGAASCVVDQIDAHGRLWSDVYYEDQVIKDGRETMAAALAGRSFELLAQLEDRLGRGDRSATYRELRDRLGTAVRSPLPQGYWDAGESRFVDWVDRSGGVHDHLHLLGNVLPVLFGQADAAQADAVHALVAAEFDEFQRFPTFLAARIADYTESEMGTAGPYDLCAAGRYWCWDAAYWSWRGRGDVLRDQLDRVAREGAREDHLMGERYDLDHVYYVDGSPWHGAEKYYEYPCVFSWVLFTEYLGVRASLDADLLIAPRIVGTGSVTLRQRAYQLRYTTGPGSFSLENLAVDARTFDVDLSAVLPGYGRMTVRVGPGATLRIGAS